MRKLILAAAFSLSFTAPVLADGFDDSLAKVKQTVDARSALVCPTAESPSLCRLEFMAVSAHLDAINMRVSTAKIQSHMGIQVNTEDLSSDFHAEMEKITQEYTTLVDKYSVKK